MLHKYRKTALIEAEQFDGSIKQIARYKVHIVGPTSRGDTSYFLLPEINSNKREDSVIYNFQFPFRESTVLLPFTTDIDLNGLAITSTPFHEQNCRYTYQATNKVLLARNR